MKKPTILIVDDDYITMVPLRDLLAIDLGYSVELTADAQLPVLLTEKSFDLICLDLMIHHESLVEAENGEQELVDNIHFEGTNWKETGLEFLSRLRSGKFSKPGTGTSPDVPVLVLSAVADHDTVERVDQYGQNSPTWFVEKPFRTLEVIKHIENALTEA